ncbi:WecB/TagA/CpsF family glycosyltransferase [Kutzneria sp. CA-103260]|uniref:WecB/TagA/CpsF family glycosyltransferase n=1 Tax=Kutzneria sp. CA-103260 TaxID=2802641 RepID=UPI001BA96EBD|nr:WecB/TagA/CpsF family glycosyltransferase [Kutzneria sp. CA-103260]QUQ70398.1 N-acetylglucosaminyldiphosphoundecaprenol N-acetyl-beta-D-mannosaminyltransferase [Kutzneria sp. CA-103260]
MRAGVPTITVLGVPVAALTARQAIAEVSRLLAEPGPQTLVYVNAHSVNLARSHDRYRACLAGADLVLNDGSGVALAARVRGHRFPANLNGTDFTPEVLRLAAQRGLGVYLLGGRDGVAARAADRLREIVPGLRVVGHHHGYVAGHQGREVAEQIKQSGADLVLVAMGNPRQELWMAEHLHATGAELGVAVGAFLDFAAERVPRAPKWMRDAGIEWLYRLSREPRRLFARYVVGNPLFVARVLADRVLATSR